MEILAVLFWLWVFFGIINLRKRHKERVAQAVAYSPENTQGAAAFATDAEIAAGGGFRKGEIFVGRSLESNREIFYNPKEGQLKPCIAIGGMGSLKTTSNQIPLSLGWKGSLIILEATIETAATTAHYRRRFGPVKIVNPMGAHRQYLKGLPEVRFNPMDPYWLNPRDPNTFGTRMAKIAAGCAEEENSRDKYWDNTSRGLIKTIGMALCELSAPGTANLGRVADILYEDPLRWTQYAVRRVKNPKLRSRLMRYARPGAGDIKSINEVIQNTNTQMEFLMEEAITHCTSRADIKIGSLRQQVQTLIFVMPLSSLGVLDRFKTLALECSFSELQSEQFDGDVSVGILCDEVGQHGYMASLKLAMSSLRKFNCFASLCINDYGTLTEIYKEGADTFLNNAGLTQWMSTKDLRGSEHLNKLLGKKEVYGSSKSINAPLPGYNGAMTVNTNRSQTSRDLLFGYEIRQLNPRHQIVQMDGVAKPILCEKVPYHETYRKRLARPNPYHRSKSFWG